MKIQPRKFQVGGEMEAPVEEPMPAETPEQGAQQDPLMQLAEMAAQALQSQDPNMAFQVCQALLELIQAAQGGGAPQGQPVFRKGGIISKRK